MIQPVAMPPPPDGGAVALVPGILWIRLPMPMGPGHVNAYALAEPDGWTIIDTGLDSSITRAAWQGLIDGPLQGRPIRRVLVTHHHLDHMGLAGWFTLRGAELLTSRTAWLLARMQVLDRQELPTPQALDFWRRAGMPAAMLAERAVERPFNMADRCHPLSPGFTRLAQGDTVTLGARTWDVHEGNGHAPEHLTLWGEDADLRIGDLQIGGLVIGGDQLLPSISPNLGVYPIEPAADTVGDWLESCARLGRLARPDQLVLPGHGLPFIGLPERLAQMASNHHAALDRLAEALRQAPRTAAGCFDLLYRRRINPANYGLALAEAVGHINHLAATGRVWRCGQTDDGGVLWGA